MDQIDLEAATEEENPIMVSDSGKRDNDERLAPRSKDQYPGTDMEEDRRLYDVAQTFIEEVLRAFPKFLEQHLRDKSKRYESLDLVSAQERTVAGSKDNTQHEEHDHSKASIGPIYDTTLASKKTSLVDSLQGCVDAAFSADFTAPIHTTPDNPLQSNNLGHAHLDYRQRVEMMTEEDIEAENEDRRDLRALWRGDKDCSYLEDPWKYIRRGDKRMFDESTNEQRKELQLELIDALFSCKHEPKLDELLDRRLPAIACWISLVGVRLNKAFEEPAAALKQAEVLIECIWVCKSSDPARVCDVLRSCYRRGILDQPSFHDQVDWSAPKAILGTHIAMVRIAIYLLNILHKPAKRPVDIIEDLDGFWSMPLSMVEETMRCRPPEMDLSVDRGTFFAVADFGLRDLQKVGQLRIQWTSYWDEHLELETSGHATTLKLYWFSPTLSRFFQIT